MSDKKTINNTEFSDWAKMFRLHCKELNYNEYIDGDYLINDYNDGLDVEESAKNFVNEMYNENRDSLIEPRYKVIDLKTPIQYALQDCLDLLEEVHKDFNCLSAISLGKIEHYRKTFLNHEDKDIQ